MWSRPVCEVSHSSPAEPGVIAVLTLADMDDLAPPPPSSGEWDGSPAPLGGPWAEPLLSIDTVRFLGEPVAVVITDGRYQGEDAAGLVTVNYEPLPVVLGPAAAVADETLLFPAAGTNVAIANPRSEERRVGKQGRARWAPDPEEKTVSEREE